MKIVGGGGLCPPEAERGRAWEPSQGSHYSHNLDTDTTPSRPWIALITVRSWSTWPTSTWKVLIPRRSSVVLHLAWEILTPCSVKHLEMDARMPGRSWLSTSTATGRGVCAP